MDKKISQLDQLTIPTQSDLLPIVQGGETRSIQYSDLVPNQFPGWGRYDDTQYTSASPLSLTDGVVVTLPNNALQTVTDTLFQFYDPITQKLNAENIGDVYMITVVFKSKAPNTNTTHLDLTFHSPVGDFDRLSKSIGYYKGNDTEQNFHNVFQFYADADLVTNGLEVKIKSEGGSAVVYDIIYFIQRTQVKRS